jgi:hypothetical protein
MYKVTGSDNKEYGPVSLEQIRQWINEGRVNSRTKVQSEGGSDWKPLGEFAEFSELLQPGISAPPLVSATPPAQSRTSRMAIASLVLGILGCFTLGVTALIGLILGIVSLVKINRSRGALRGTGVALAGTILSGAFLLALPILAALLLPALAQAKAKAQGIVCMTNLKQLALGNIMYAGDNKNQFPSGANWCDAIQKYVPRGATFLCPAGDATRQCHYALNAKLAGAEMNTITAPAQTVLLFEIEGGWNASGGPELLLKRPRHHLAVGLVFADGHAEIARESRLQTLRWDP